MAKTSNAQKPNLKRVCLTQKGWQKLEAVINRLAKEEQSNAAIGRRCECDRETISKIRNRKGAVTFSKLESVFSSVDLDLEEEDWQGAQGESAPPASRRNEQLLSQPAIPFLCCSQQVAELLWDLNCIDQVTEFERNLGSRPAHVFIVQAKGNTVQKWLIKRLLLKRQNAQKYCLDARVQLRLDFDEFWRGLTRKFNLASRQPEALIEEVCMLAQTQLVVIAVYGLASLRPIRDQILSKFWIPLHQQLSTQSTKSSRAGVLLFLADDPENLAFPPPVCANLFPLPALTAISTDEIRRWITLDPVYEALIGKLGEPNVNQVVENELGGWQLSPQEVIDELCYLFQLPNGLAEIETYWELAG